MEAATFREVRLDGGVIRYREVGTGPALVFVHGILANVTLWREVVADLSGRIRCIVPDLPLGGHSVAMEAGADLMEELDLRDVTLVGNDTGGAICQVLISNHPECIGTLVLSNCDAYEAFFPVVLRPNLYAARVFGMRYVDLFAWTLRVRFARRALIKMIATTHIDDATLETYLGPLIQDPGVRSDLARLLGSVSNRYTIEAAQSFPGFDRPVLIVWGLSDPFFSLRLALRLKHDFPDARLEAVPGSRALVSEDRPERLAQLIGEFLEEVTGQPRDGSREVFREIDTDCNTLARTV